MHTCSARMWPTQSHTYLYLDLYLHLSLSIYNIYIHTYKYIVDSGTWKSDRERHLIAYSRCIISATSTKLCCLLHSSIGREDCPIGDHVRGCASRAHLVPELFWLVNNENQCNSMNGSVNYVSKHVVRLSLRRHAHGMLSGAIQNPEACSLEADIRSPKPSKTNKPT